MTKIERAKEINKLLAQYDYEYFTNNRSLITDDEYDNLWFELKHLLTDQEVKKALSKTDMSIGIQTSYLSKITHPKSVLSLDKEKIDDPNFSKKLSKFIDTYNTNDKWTISEKLDGLTIVAYKQNDSVTFATRGGSTVGENVTHQFVKNNRLIEAAYKAPNGMTIRGEGIIPIESFKKIMSESKDHVIDMYNQFLNDEHYHLLTVDEEVQSFLDEYFNLDMTLRKELYQKKKVMIDKLNQSLLGYDSEFSRLGKSTISKLSKAFLAREKLYSNARNLASASVRTNDTNVALTNNVKFVTYDIMNSFNFGITTEEDVVDTLKSYGFDTVKHIIVTTDELIEFFKDDTKMNEWRNSSEYEIDGLVIKPHLKIENPKSNEHHEKGQLAIKFKAKGEYSVLRDVEWNLSSNGRYSPVAVFDDVSIGGSVINKASLNSWKSIQDLDLMIGDQIYVVRANDVIPQISSVLKDKRTGKEIKIQLPKNSELKGGIIYSNDELDLPLDQQIQKFMQRVGSKNIGKAVIKKLIANDFVSSISDMFLLNHHKDSLVKIKGLGEQAVNQLLEEIESVKPNLTFYNVIYGLGIEGLGKKSIKDLIDFMPNVDVFKSLTEDQVNEADELYGISISTHRGLKKLYNNPDDLLDLSDMGLIL